MRRLPVLLLMLSLSASPLLAQEASPPENVVTATAAAETPEVDLQEGLGNPGNFLFTEPIEIPTAEQIEAARECAPLLDAGTPPEDVELEESCALAFEALQYAEEPRSVAGREALAAVMRTNPALLLTDALLVPFYNSQPLVSLQVVPESRLTSLRIEYRFSGMGSSVTDDFVFIGLDTASPELNGTVLFQDWMGITDSTADDAEDLEPTSVDGLEFDLEQVLELPQALTDLVPIEQTFSSQPCWDYYPDWTITFAFADGTEIVAKTNNSNAIGIGGPWQIELDGQAYMQYSGALADSILDLFASLEFPIGQTAAMGCGGGESLFSLAYPEEESAD